MPLRSLIKQLLPSWMLADLRRRRTELEMRQLMRNWESARGQLNARTVARPLRRVLIVPSDPNSLVGALGDDAMISAAVQTAKALNPQAEIHTLTSRPEATAQAKQRNQVPQEIWGSKNFPAAVASLLNRVEFDVVAALGADILDGYYDPVSAAQALVVCDLAARSGVPATMLGFSFNASPNPLMRQVFLGLHEGVKMHPRDQISLDRLRAFANVPLTLVADSAFMLAAETPPQDIVAWVDAQRTAGNRVIGVNVHPMLIKNATEAQVEQIIKRVSTALLRVADRQPVAWLMLPHDYRAENGDARCLSPIAAFISPKLTGRVQILTGEHSAAVLKGAAGLLDGVMTGRMHLAIGSLGMGVPTLCITYQDKFEGLYRHFDLPEWLLMNSEEMLGENELAERLERFIYEINALRASLENSLQNVLALSKKNFSVFS